MTENNSASTEVDAHRLSQFLVALIVLVSGFTLVTWVADLSIVALGPLYMFTPGIAGLAVCLFNGVSLSAVGLRIGRWRWIALSTVLSLPIIGLVVLISLGIPGVSFDPSLDLASELGLPSSGIHWFIVALFVMVFYGATINALLGFGEEFGWRGYLLWELAPLGFWKASFVIGAVWGLWHAPLILAGHNYPSFPVAGVLAFTVICITMSPIFTLLVVRGQSVLPAAVFHGVFNATAGLVAYAGTQEVLLRELVASPAGVVGFLVFSFVSVAIARVGAPRLSRAFASNEGVVRTSGEASGVGADGNAPVVGDRD